jgi:hypothetical protein
MAAFPGRLHVTAVESRRCAYVARQLAVKAKYGLWVTRPEHAVIRASAHGSIRAFPEVRHIAATVAAS